MNFGRKLNWVLSEMEGPRITGVRFLPTKPNQYGAEVTYEDGLVEILFDFDPAVCSFAAQELVGMTKEEALWLKDRKTDQAIGVDQPI